MADNSLIKANNLKAMKTIIRSPEMVGRITEAVGKNAGAFTASVLDLYNNNDLAMCNPQELMVECMKAAALQLPISRSLGFAYIVPYGGKPQFQMGYRGLIQLAQRSGQYKTINAGAVYEGETVNKDRITGAFTIDGTATSDKAIGYFAYFELLNGFKKMDYWTRQQVESHKNKYARGANRADSAWQTQYDAMAIKTVLKSILQKYGVLSIEMANVMEEDNTKDPDVIAQENGNRETIAFETNSTVTASPIEPAKSPTPQADEPAPF